MERNEQLARAGHEAVLFWADKDAPHPMLQPWDELSEEDRATLVAAAEHELLHPGEYDDQLYPAKGPATQAFIEGLFRGTVRRQHEIMQQNAKEQ